MCAARVGFSAKFGLFRKASFPTQSWHIPKIANGQKAPTGGCDPQIQGCFRNPAHQTETSQQEIKKLQNRWDKIQPNHLGSQQKWQQFIWVIFTISTRWPDSFHHFFSQNSHKIVCLFVRSFEALVYPRDDEDEYELGGELGSGHMNMSFTCNIAPFHKEHSPPPHNAQPAPEIKNEYP